MPSDKRARQRANRIAGRAAAEAEKRRRSTRRRGVVIGAVVVIGVVLGVVLTSTGKSSHPVKPAKVAKVSTKKAPSTSASAQALADEAAVKAGCPGVPTAGVKAPSFTSAPPMSIDTSKTYTATVTTSLGPFTITLDASQAPHTVNNFVFLADHGFYNCNSFWRVIPGFVDQTGDPTGTGTGGPGYHYTGSKPAVAKNPSHQYPLGAVAMANSASPTSNGSQFFIVAGSQGESLPANYTLFGQVTSGMNVVEQVNKAGNASPSANGAPPDVIYRMLKVTISSS